MSLAPGTYTARGVTAALGIASTGSEQIAVELEVLDPDYAGQRITWFGFFTEATEARTFEALRHLGWKGDELTDLGGIDQNEVRIVCDNETYQGQTRLKVQWINAPGGLALKTPMTPEQVRAFAARMKSKAGASRAKMGTQSNGQDAPMPTDEDAPF